MLAIKFSRQGTKKKPVFRIIVCEKARDPWGKYLENLGIYNPKTKESTINAERVQYWISKGAQPTATVHNLLITKEIIKGEKVRASKAQPGKKKSLVIAQQKAVEVANKKAEVEARKKADEEAKVAAEAVPETAPVETVPEVIPAEVVAPEPEPVVETAVVPPAVTTASAESSGESKEVMAGEEAPVEVVAPTEESSEAKEEPKTE